MYPLLQCLVVTWLAQLGCADPSASFPYPEVKGDIFDQPITFLGSKKMAHDKDTKADVVGPGDAEALGYDFSRFDSYLSGVNEAANPDSPDHNRIKRRAKPQFGTLIGPKLRERSHHYTYPKPVKERIMEFTSTTRKPSILPENMNPGVIFRVRMSDAILRIKQRLYSQDTQEHHIESDIIYTNLIKKVVMDEITKFHNLLLMYKTDKAIKEHLGECGGRIYKFISYMTIKRRHGRRKNKHRGKSDDGDATEPPVTTQSDGEPQIARKATKKPSKRPDNYDNYELPVKDREKTLYVEMPKDLYQAHLRPGVIFRIHMSEAVLKMQYRNYVDDSDESVIDADVEYLRLTRKVISDEITKFEDLKWLTEWFTNRSELVQEHVCNTRYFAVGTPPTMFTHAEEYMKRMCLFDSVYLDHIPYVVGEDSSLVAAVAPPVLHCDAATCTSVPFIDSVMFDERLARTNVRTVTRCQASCRAHCRNDPDCLKRCTDRCFRID